MNHSTHLLMLVCALATGCSSPDAPTEQQAPLHFEVAGRLENPKIIEASGLARSQREPGVLWTINDSGNLGRVDLNKSDHRDWEDLASFQLDGDPYLLVADIGDNDARFKKRTIYVAKEPRTDENKTKVDWEVPERSTRCRGGCGRHRERTHPRAYEA
jgi:hypothetical protein